MEPAAARRAQSAAPSEAQASDIGDVASLEGIEDFEDDEKWHKVAKGKRAAVLLKQRDILASGVSRSLSKVSAAQSPFNKKKDDKVNEKENTKNTA